jgi:Delta3-Delta2-enoyl-CoA isomerase
MSGTSVYGVLKREMWRETLQYLESFGKEDERDFQVRLKTQKEREESEKRVKVWEEGRRAKL